MRQFEQYPKYKNSGIEWLGEIPEEWHTQRIKYLVKEINERSNDGDGDLLSVSQYTGVTKKSDQTDEGDLLTTASTLEGYKKVCKGDLVSNIMLAWNGSLGFSQFDGITSPAYCIYRLANQYVKGFYHYLLRTELYKSEFKRNSSGVIESRLRLYSDDFFRINAIIPPLPEQTAIATFLDEKTAKIDKAISQKEKLIALLKERKQIMIQNAVTKGLDPNVKMKDSGVEWIGDIPEEWEVLPNKVLFAESKANGNESLPLLSVSLHTGVSTGELDEEENIRGKVKIEDKSCYKLVKPNYIAYNMMRAWQGAIGAVSTEGMVSPAYVVAIPNQEVVNALFFEYQYRTSSFIQQMNRFSRGITDFRKRLYWNEFKQLNTIVPPIQLQQQIVDFITNQSSKIDNAIAVQEKQIDKLKEYKAVLIDSVVTGKIKVC